MIFDLQLDMQFDDMYHELMKFVNFLRCFLLFLFLDRYIDKYSNKILNFVKLNQFDSLIAQYLFFLYFLYQNLTARRTRHYSHLKGLSVGM